MTTVAEVKKAMKDAGIEVFRHGHYYDIDSAAHVAQYGDMIWVEGRYFRRLSNAKLKAFDKRMQAACAAFNPRVDESHGFTLIIQAT